MTTPKVSIIILNWNKLEYTKNCIHSIEQNSHYPNYEIIVFDNGSTEKGTKEFLTSLNHKVIMNPENIGFARGNNKAVEAAEGELLLFLNNDIVAHKNWLLPMVKIFQQHPDCGIVGSKLLYPDGTIQHIGVMFDWRGNRRHIFKRYPPDILFAKETQEREAVTGACLLIRKDIFKKVSGFDEKYIHGSEDIDLCLKVRDMGLKVMYCPDSVLTHFEQVSLKSKGSHFKKRTTRHNNRLFLKKWGRRLDDFRLSNDFAGLRPVHYYRGSRSDIMELIPEKARFILDVGCASGMLGQSLKEKNKEFTIWGIELNKDIAKEAEKNIDKVFIADVESINKVFDNSIRFDCIIFADVLEHLKDPWSILKTFSYYLAQDGRIICSIPNIRHYKIIKDIVRDRWLYRDEGVLDIDHLRFFTLATIKNMISIAGYKIEKIKKNKKASLFMKILNILLLKKLDDFLTQQYIVSCSKHDKK